MIPTLRNSFPEWMSGGGIFSAIENISGYTPPWAGQISSVDLDIQYFGNHSGQKITSPLVDSLLSGGVLSMESINVLAVLVKGLYSKSWSKLWDTTLQEYNLIHNYSMTESETRTENRSSTDERNINSTSGATQDSSIYGFDSSSPSPSGKVEDSGTGSQSETGSGSSEFEETMTHKRDGNIGVTTAQQMLEEERKLWMWSIFDQVFTDVDKVLVTDVYSGGGDRYDCVY